MKICSKCGAEKPTDEFYVAKAGWLFPECKECNKTRSKAAMQRYRAENPDKHRANRARWSRNARLRQYGITPDEYDSLLEEQGSKCAICGSSEAGAWGGSLPVDHDHETGAVRGLLCHNCNGGLGQFQDNPELLLAAAAYLLSHQGSLEGMC